MESGDDVLIIGGGVIGLATALALLESGRGVRVLEADKPGSGSSHGNCGTLTPSHAAPLAAPGTVGRALRWMLTPDAPLYVRPRLDPALWRWLLGFARRCNNRDWRRSAQARAVLLDASRDGFAPLVERYGLECEFEESGGDLVFRSQAELDQMGDELQLLDGLGIDYQLHGGADYLAAEPALLDGVVGAVSFPGDARLRPDRYVAELARAVRDAGGRIEEDCPAGAIDCGAGGAAVQTPRGTFRGSDLVLAAGAWSTPLARALGLRLPMQPGKGYSITYTRPAIVPRRPLVLHESSICVTVWDSGYRLGSTMEFSGFDASLNRRRLDALERGAREYLREPVGPVKQEEWCGWRPLSLDDVPIIGPVPGLPRAWVATGHGMLGVSMSVATGRLVAELVTGAEPHIDPVPYDPGRFA